jgi:isopentenyl phosphate kinase
MVEAGVSRVFLKLGGSLLTDKTRAKSLRTEVLTALAEEVASALREQPNLQVLIGHGSGSFGHVTAKRFATRAGVRTEQQWSGFAETSLVAAQLHRYVVDALWSAGVPALSLQPSASALCQHGKLVELDHRQILAALDNRLTPVIYGDVAFDTEIGGTIVSTEELFSHLAPHLGPQRVILVGEVPGVMTKNPDESKDAELIPVISPPDLALLQRDLGASRGIDVTGGMLAKVRETMALLSTCPELLHAQIISGLLPGHLHDTLTRPELSLGTRILPH